MNKERYLKISSARFACISCTSQNSAMLVRLQHTVHYVSTKLFNQMIRDVLVVDKTKVLQTRIMNFCRNWARYKFDAVLRLVQTRPS
jgi:hypothetical protein